MKKYKWQQISQWDMPKKEYYQRHDTVDTGLSKAICVYLLVEIIDKGKGYIQTKPINKTDVTPKMLKIAGNV